MLLSGDEIERFWTKVQKSDGCWEWKGALFQQAKYKMQYGRFNLNRANDSAARNQNAHRVAWVIAHGQIPYGVFVCHQCDNPRCVRPDHLFLGTPKDNISDMCHKGRHRGNRKLTTEQVAEIRKLATSASQVDLAARYGVKPLAIYRILAGKTWPPSANSTSAPGKTPGSSTANSATLADSATLVVDEDGGVQFIYDDALRGLLDEGEAQITRASHVEPEGTQWIADMAPSGGEVLGPFDSRAIALAAEVTWLRLNRLGANI